MTNASQKSSQPIHCVLIDFENVHQIDVGMLKSNTVNLIVLAGAKQKKIDFDLVQEMMEHASGLKLVRLKSSSRNAVDFALAFYLGQVVLEHSSASFHLVSKDKGYEPLVTHLRDRGFDVQRVDGCQALSFSWVGKGTGKVGAKAAKKVTRQAAKKVSKKAAKKAGKKAAKQVAKKKAAAGETLSPRKALTPDEAYQRVYDNFLKPSKNLPVRKKTLLSEIRQLTGYEADSPQIAEVIKRLENGGVLDMSGAKPVFSL